MQKLKKVDTSKVVKIRTQCNNFKEEKFIKLATDSNF